MSFRSPPHLVMRVFLLKLRVIPQRAGLSTVFIIGAAFGPRVGLMASVFGLDFSCRLFRIKIDLKYWAAKLNPKP